MLKDKAVTNLRAGEALLALGLVDPAASRYYYALYQASVHALTELGRAPGGVRSGAVEWDHSMVMNNVKGIRGRWSDRDGYEAVRRLRTRADYAGRSIDRLELEAWTEFVRDFVTEVVR